LDKLSESYTVNKYCPLPLPLTNILITSINRAKLMLEKQETRITIFYHGSILHTINEIVSISSPWKFLLCAKRWICRRHTNWNSITFILQIISQRVKNFLY